ncbi:TerD family protein [Streptomyces sp.]|uniref:TerD family protein n=1 Tax=Streptomyces sp. TaxID=1931 RepID=UPI002F3FFF32
MTPGAGKDVPLPTAVLRVEFGRRAGPGTPRTEGCALLRAADGSARGPGDLVHPGAPAHPSGAVRHEGCRVSGGTAVDTLVVDLGSLESAVVSVLLVARGAGQPPGPVPGMWLRVASAGGQAARLHHAGTAGESGYVLGECYRTGGGWRFRAAGERSLPQVPPVPAPVRPPPSGPSTVTLTEQAPAVSLACQGGTAGALRIGLDWRLAHGQGSADGLGLDLCALFELSDGGTGVVQALGGAFGSLHRPPFILLHGAEPTGSPGTGEHLTLNLDHLTYFRRVLVFVTLHQGAPSLAGLRATVTLAPEHGAAVDFSLAECTVPATVCALALLTRDGTDLVVRREARYLVPRRGVSPQRTADYAYGWGLNWTPSPE